MGFFIGWSGKNTKSYMVADALRRWLEQVIQGCNPWMSSQDIDAGERWVKELFAQLDNLSIGIICVTKTNQGEPWINFEAGALAKQFKDDQADETRVCPLLIDMTENDVTGPLKFLQMLTLDKGGVFRVVQMVNKCAIKTPLSEVVLKNSFDKWWPDLETQLHQMEVPQQPEKSSRAVPEVLEEILGIVRSIDKATNRPATRSYLTVGAENPLSPLPRTSASSRIFDMGRASELAEELVTEVEKTDALLAKALLTGIIAFDGQTLTIEVRQIIPEQHLEPAYKAATSLGIPLKIVYIP